jgi:hypothetical protein
MARSSKNTSGSSRGSSRSAGGGRPQTTQQNREVATKGAIREAFLRKKDELLKLKSLDIFLIKDAMGINPKKSDMKPELREIVKKLKEKQKRL